MKNIERVPFSLIEHALIKCCPCQLAMQRLGSEHTVCGHRYDDESGSCCLCMIESAVWLLKEVEDEGN